ncbi:CMRF35-like molecule 1 isoform X1 [Alligator mississippiensis]|uniref:CMRF35-like molecule 1 n=1 Tax=Alligator mississippiensis TaxID=8496 RepID=A0A151N2W4_ALLMI|nr:CMRF35-like molecule 1 isoform X1 [Alligator mississippiensis]KYO31110.1 CMRF35-like molecule 1 [Alligator mississippiensis]
MGDSMSKEAIMRTMWLPLAGGVLLLSGYFSVLAAQLTGPGEMSGVLGQSVSVPCQYMENYQTKKKYWCRGENWESCSKVVESTGSEDEVRQGRVSLRDNHFLHTFTVTLENLTLEDMGTYWCGINQFGQDLNAPVKVTVFPDLSATKMVITAGFISTVSSTVSPRMTTHASPASSIFTNPMFLLPMVILVLILLIGILGFLLARRRMLKRQEADAVLETTPGSSEAPEEAKSDIVYANVTTKPRKSIHQSLTRSSAQPEHCPESVEYACVALEEAKGDVFYTSVTTKPKKLINQSLTLSSAQPEHCPESVEYSCVAPERTMVSYSTLKFPMLELEAYSANMDGSSRPALWTGPLERTEYC